MPNPEFPSSVGDAVSSIVHRLGGDKFAADVLIARAGEIHFNEDGKALEIIIPGTPEVKLTIGDDKSVKMETFGPGNHRFRTEYLYDVDRIIADPLSDSENATLAFRGKYNRGFLITTKRVRAGVLRPSQGLYI